jgi:hypothetical protein
MITNDTIIALKPCKDILDNYLQHYTGVTLTHEEFLDSTLITYEDKIWVYKRILTKTQIIRWGALCAQSVLHLYESEHPNDSRPRDLVSCLLAGVTNETGLARLTIAASDAYDAAYAAYAAAYAASAAASDAAYAAYAASRATYAAAYAASDAASAAAYAAAYAAASAVQRDLNLSFIKTTLGAHPN